MKPTFSIPQLTIMFESPILRQRPKTYIRVPNVFITSTGPIQLPITISNRYGYSIRDWNYNHQLLKALEDFHDHLTIANANVGHRTPVDTSAIYQNTLAQSGTSALTVNTPASVVFYISKVDKQIILADPGRVVASNLQLGSVASLSPIPPLAPPVDSSPEIEMTDAEPIPANPLLDHIDGLLSMGRILPISGTSIRPITYNTYFNQLKKLRDLVPPFYVATKMTTSLTRIKDIESPGDGWSEGPTSERMEDFPSAASSLVIDCFFLIMREHTERLSCLVQLGTPPMELRELQIDCELFDSYSPCSSLISFRLSEHANQCSLYM